MRCAATLFVLAGFAAGAAAVQGLHAQTKPPTYVVIEIDVQEPDKYQKEFAPPRGEGVHRGGRQVPSAHRPCSRYHRHSSEAGSLDCIREPGHGAGVIQDRSL
jgi:hypothetical protein